MIYVLGAVGYAFRIQVRCGAQCPTKHAADFPQLLKKAPTDNAYAQLTTNIIFRYT